MTHIEALIATEIAKANERLAKRYEIVEFDGEDLAVRKKLIVFANGAAKDEGAQADRFTTIWPNDAIEETLGAVFAAFPSSARLYVRWPFSCVVQEGFDNNEDWVTFSGVTASIRCVGDEVFG